MKRKYINPMREKLRELDRASRKEFDKFIISQSPNLLARRLFKKELTTGHDGDE